jgi:hypothetical protein
MVVPRHNLPNSQGASVERLGIPESTLPFISLCESVDRVYDTGMVGTKLRLADCKDLLRKGNGFRIFARSNKSICGCAFLIPLFRSNRRGEANTKLRIAPAQRALRLADFILPSPCACKGSANPA